MAPSTATPRWTDLIGSAALDTAVEQARSAVGALRRHPSNRQGRPRSAAAASVRAARASASLAGAPLTLDLESDTVTDPVLAGALRASAAIGSMSGVWARSPLQVLARLHTLAAADLVAPENLGRPRTTDPMVGARLVELAQLVTAAPWPAPIQVAVVHGELLALRPFGSADGVVARAAARLTMISTGLDPAGLGVPEVAHLGSVARYREFIAGLRSGESSIVADWAVEISRCLVLGAREGLSIADAATRAAPSNGGSDSIARGGR